MIKPLSIIFIGLGIGIVGISTAACCDNRSARVKGHFIGLAGEEIYLESLSPQANSHGIAAGNPAGSHTKADSTFTDSKGRFGFRVPLPGGQPAFFNIRHGDDVVPVVLSPREKVSVMSFGNEGRGYRISGSRESELVWRAHSIVANGAASLDSISRLLIWSANERRGELTRAYWDEYKRIKREQIRFIVENPSSMAAIWALYERLPEESMMPGGVNNRVYYQMVADSTVLRYPDSRYVVALKKSVEL